MSQGGYGGGQGWGGPPGGAPPPGAPGGYGPPPGAPGGYGPPPGQFGGPAPYGMPPAPYGMPGPPAVEGSLPLGALAGFFGGCIGLILVLIIAKGPATKKGAWIGFAAGIVVGTIIRVAAS